MAELNHKQRRFAFEYAKDGHGTNAALRAGYAQSGASQQSTVLLENPKIQEIIEYEKRAAANLATMSFAKIILELSDMAEADRSKIVKLVCDPCLNCYSIDVRKEMKAAGMARLVDVPNPECQLCAGRGIERVQLTPTDQLPANVRKCILGYKQDKDGRISVQTMNPLEPLMHIAKMLGYNPDRKELSGPGGTPIQIATASKPPSLMSDEELDAIFAQNQLRDSVKGVLEGVFLELPASTDDSKVDK